MDVFRVLSLPLVPVYCAVTILRNKLFDTKIFTEAKTKAFVVSIGNITVGGSGKTPFTIYMAALLKAKGRSVGVLSRGYGRVSKGYKLVSDGENMLASVEDAGDEIYYTALECNVFAAVSENRVEGANKLIHDCKVDAIVLDDAFQHRWIARDVDIVVLDQRFVNHDRKLRRMMLPTGNLREPFSSLKRADCIIFNRKFSVKEEILDELREQIPSDIPLFTAGYSALGFIDVRNNRFYEPSEFSGQKSLLVSGVANPHSFKEALRSIGIDTGMRIVFPDHKAYTNEDVQLIRREFYAKNAHSVITTQKDAVKLMQFRKELDDIDIYYLKISMELDDRSGFESFMDKKILEHT
ncbi:MAG: tetraacyldisaccharide 4'-kinase [Ignavibacteriales bacterium]|nr:tetraacyldisaccharide 4'-kinase [Ignavibacteriales bacterium]